MINIHNFTPMPSLIILGCSSLIMLVISDIYILINYLAFAESAIVTMAVAGLIKMRFYNKDLPRPIKLNLIIPFTFFIACIYIIVVPFISKPFELIVATGIIVSGVPIYFLFIYWENKPNWIILPWAHFIHFVQAVLLCVPGESA
jgi:L-type amino acid transporter 5